MLDFEKKPAKRTNIAFLSHGSVIHYNSEFFIFDKIPIGSNSMYVRDLNNLKHMKIPISSNSSELFFDVVGYVDIDSLKPQNNFSSLEKGDLFVIDVSDAKGSYIFRFERATDRTVFATNPMNNKEVRISNRYIFTKIDNLPF